VILRQCPSACVWLNVVPKELEQRLQSSRELPGRRFTKGRELGDTTLMMKARHILDGETVNDASTSSNSDVQQSPPISAGQTAFCGCPPRSIYGQDFWIGYPWVLKEKMLGA